MRPYTLLPYYLITLYPYPPISLSPYLLSPYLPTSERIHQQQKSLPHRNDPKHDLLGTKLDVIESNRVLWFPDDALLSSVFVHVHIYDHHPRCA